MGKHRRSQQGAKIGRVANNRPVRRLHYNIRPCLWLPVSLVYPAILLLFFLLLIVIAIAVVRVLLFVATPAPVVSISWRV